MRRLMLVFSCLLLVTWCNAADVCATIRDPFVIPDPKKAPSSKQSITLEGIVYAGQKRSAAVLVCGDQREVVQRGQRFAGYQLVMIGKDFVVLVRGKQKKKLFIQ